MSFAVVSLASLELGREVDDVTIDNGCSSFLEDRMNTRELYILHVFNHIQIAVPEYLWLPVDINPVPSVHDTWFKIYFCCSRNLQDTLTPLQDPCQLIVSSTRTTSRGICKTLVNECRQLTLKVAEYARSCH